MEVKYIDNDPEKGIKYDWKKIRREYKKLGIPKYFFNPLKADYENCGYNMALSDRSRGKTTQSLLLGMLMHEMYGTIPHYLRNDDDMIKPKQLKDLFPVILDHGYVQKITHDKWNSVYYYGSRWFYCLRDDDGNIVEKCPDHFMRCISLDDVDKLRSSYSCPRGDMIIYDEFIKLGGYGYSDYVRFSDIVSTIFRKRLCPFVIMLSNTIDRNSPWFDEFCIRDEIEMMQQGECRYIETVEKTKLFVEIMQPDSSELRKSVNMRFFGFPNPKLASITGKGAWATEHYPHIRPAKDSEPEILFNRLFMRQSGKLVKLRLVRDVVGLCVYVTPATKIYDDSVVLVNSDITDPREVFGFGACGSWIQSIWRLYNANRFYYATNSEGELVRAFIKSVQTKQKVMLL